MVLEFDSLRYDSHALRAKIANIFVTSKLFAGKTYPNTISQRLQEKGQPLLEKSLLFQ